MKICKTGTRTLKLTHKFTKIPDKLLNSHGTHRLAKGEIPHLNHFAWVFSQSNFHESERRLGSQRVESPDGRVAERLHLRVLVAQFEEDTSKGRIELAFWPFSGKPTKIWAFFEFFLQNSWRGPFPFPIKDGINASSMHLDAAESLLAAPGLSLSDDDDSSRLRISSSYRTCSTRFVCWKMYVNLWNIL